MPNLLTTLIECTIVIHCLRVIFIVYSGYSNGSWDRKSRSYARVALLYKAKKSQKTGQEKDLASQITMYYYMINYCITSYIPRSTLLHISINNIYCIFEVSIDWGYPQNGWFIMENPITKHDLVVSPFYGNMETLISVYYMYIIHILYYTPAINSRPAISRQLRGMAAKQLLELYRETQQLGGATAGPAGPAGG